jgi:nucleoporin NDC1
LGNTIYRIIKISLISVPLFYLLYIPLSAQFFNYGFTFLAKLGIDTAYSLESISQVDLVTTIRLLLIGTFLGASFYFPNHIYEIIHTQLFQFESNGTSYLLDALSYMSSPFIQYLAYLDLHHLAHWSPQRRSYFYGDTTGDSWRRLLNLVCDRVDSISTSIYKLKYAKNVTFPVPNGQISSGTLGSLQRRLDNLLKKNRVENPLEDLHLYVWAIEAISTMTCTSMREDRFGVVQNCDTIPILLNSLLSCLSAVEDYLNTPLNLGVKDSSLARLEGYQIVRQPALVLVTVLNNAIYLIVSAFYENLSYFKLPPKHALKLQQFVNFKE